MSCYRFFAKLLNSHFCLDLDLLQRNTHISFDFRELIHRKEFTLKHLLQSVELNVVTEMSVAQFNIEDESGRACR